MFFIVYLGVTAAVGHSAYMGNLQLLQLPKLLQATGLEHVSEQAIYLQLSFVIIVVVLVVAIAADAAALFFP